MVRYHCPYCSPRYQIHQQRSDGVKVCGHCGDPLVMVSAIRPTQVAGLLTAAAFIVPLIVMLLSLHPDKQRPEPNRPSPPNGFVSLSSYLLGKAYTPLI